jgi:hypothetical protein
MTTNRLLTTLVQLGIGVPALLMARLVWREIVSDYREWANSH